MARIWHSPVGISLLAPPNFEQVNLQAWLFNFIIQGMSQRNSRESPCLPNIELTHKSRQLRKKTRDAKQRWLSQAIADLNEDERAMHFKAGDIIRRLAER